MAAEQLLVTEGEQRGALLSVEGELVLGRVAPQKDGRLGGDPEISRRHARISLTADRRMQIEDLGSANGTFVNDERIAAVRVLEVGDVVRLGKTALKVTGGASPTRVPLRPSEAASETRRPSADPPVPDFEL